MNRARRWWRLLWLGTSAALLLTPSLAAAAAARTITFGGASAAQPLVADLAFFYRRAAANPPRFAIVGGGTAIGLADTARGVVDAGLTDRPPGRNDPRGLQYAPVARTTLCLVTNPANPVANVTRAELAGIAVAVAEAAPFGNFTQVRDYVLVSPTGYGYVEFGYTAGLNVVAVDGVACSARRELGIVTRGPPRGELARFLRWVASDATARRVIASRYVVP